jgi:hypothetical protein
MSAPRRARSLPLALLLLPPLGTASAQEPRVGKDWYRDELQLGFRVKVPKGWDQIPPRPDDRALIVAYSDPDNSYVPVGDDALLPISMFLVLVDNRPSAETDGFSPTRTTLLDAIEERVPDADGWEFDARRYPRPLSLRGVERAEVTVWSAPHLRAPEATVRVFAAEYELEPDLSVGNYENAWSKLARTFARVELSSASAQEETGLSPRDQKRRRLEAEVRLLDDWRLFETENYFVLTDVDDRRFLDDLLERLEAIRAVYEQHYPPDRARAIARRRARPEPGEIEATLVPGTEPERTLSAIDPLAASRTSVVRVCKSAALYEKYGGPPRSAGFWNPSTEELVLYDDKADGGRDDTWITLNHEAFHQYIHYFYGALAPHSWYNEGNGDFYSGYDYRHGRFRLKENAWRVRVVQQNLRIGRFAPLRDFVHWTKSEYYGDNYLELGGADCYAQGWSLVYFLRTAPERRPRGWRPVWGEILDRYLEVLATTGDLRSAIDRAFAGLDWDALERCWKDYVLGL